MSSKTTPIRDNRRCIEGLLLGAGPRGVAAPPGPPIYGPATIVADADAMRGVVGFAEEAKLWVEPATGCLVPAARRVIERVDDDVSLGFVVCGGNVTHSDVRAWVDRLL